MTAYAPQGRSASVRSYRLWTRLDRLPQSGQHAVIRRARRVRVIVESNRIEVPGFEPNAGPVRQKVREKVHSPYLATPAPIIKIGQEPNWATYDASLRARGSLTVWFTAEAMEAWKAEPRTGRGGQPRYSDLAIATALTLRTVFRLALRQTEGLIGSVLQLLGLDLPVPDHSTLSRRAETLEVPRPKAGSEPVHLLVDSTGLKFCGPGEWLVEKHGTKRRRSWRSSTSPRTPTPARSSPRC